VQPAVAAQVYVGSSMSDGGGKDVLLHPSGRESGSLQTRQPGTMPRSTVVVLVLLSLLVIGSDVRQSLHKGVYDPNDFATLYAGSICVAQSCNPYSVPDLDAVLVRERGTQVRQAWYDQLPIYPPTTLLTLFPFSLLSYQKATGLWYALSFFIYIGGLLWVFLFSPCLRAASPWLRTGAVLVGLHFPKLVQCLGFGNPSLIVTGLLLFAVFDEVRSRYGLRVCCAFLACLLKAPLAVPLTLLVLFRDRAHWRRSWIVLGAFSLSVCVMLLIAGIPKGMQGWRQDLTRNIVLGESHGMNPSARISPSNALLNFESLPGYFTSNAHTIAAITIATVALFAALYIFGAARLYRRNLWDARSYTVVVSAMAILTLMPVYHRFCDIGMILFVLPWIIQRFPSEMRWQPWLALPLVSLLYFSWERRIHIDSLSGTGHGVIQFLYYRGDPLLLLILTATLIAALYAESTRALPKLAGLE
jgi:hypothetical protein